MKECYCGKLCKGLRGLKAHQSKVLDLPELREMFQQLLKNRINRISTTVTKYRKISGAIVKKYLSQNWLYSPLLIGPLVSVTLKTL